MIFRIGDQIDSYHLVKHIDTGAPITNLNASNFNIILIRDGATATESVSVAHVTQGYYRFRFTALFSGRYDEAVEVLGNFAGSPGGGFEARTFWVLDAGASLPWAGFGRAIISIELLRSWAPQTALEVDDTELQRCIDAASAWIETRTGRLYVAVDIVESHEGCRAFDHVLVTTFRPLLYPADPMTVFEDGAALTVGSGYSPTSEIIVYPKQGKLSRQTGCWSRSALSNIAVTYRCGWEALVVPSEVMQLSAEVAWSMHKEAMISGLNEISGPETSVKIVRSLSPTARDTLDAYTDYRESTAVDWSFA